MRANDMIIYQNQNQIIVTVLVLGILFIAFGVFAVIMNHLKNKRLEKIALYQCNTAATIDSSIPQILELIIQESFTDYKVKYLVPMQEGFLNSDREEEIRKDLVELVVSRMSNAVLDKISLFYNLENMGAILADKIYIIVMNYVIDHNASLDTEENK